MKLNVNEVTPFITDAPCSWMETKETTRFWAALIIALAFRQVELSEDIQLVQGGYDHEGKVPDEQNDAVLAVQFPAVKVRRHDQEDDCGEQAECGVNQACKRTIDKLTRSGCSTR